MWLRKVRRPVVRRDWVVGRLRVIRYPLYHDKMYGWVLYVDRTTFYRRSLEIMVGNRVYVFDVLEP